MFATSTELYSIEHSDNHHTIRLANVNAEIVMDSSDAMTTCHITVTDNERASVGNLQTVKEYVLENYGAKAWFTFASNIAFPITEESPDRTVNVRVIDLQNQQQLIDRLFSKRKEPTAHIEHIRAQYDLIKSEEWRVITTPEECADKYEAIFYFKKHNTTFVTEQKIRDNIYSSEAEELKIANENILQLTVLDEEDNIAATLKVLHHANMLYFADYIVREDLRNNGVGQALAIYGLELATEKFASDDHPIEYAWYIGGGDGERGNGAHLTEQLGAIPYSDLPEMAAGMYAQFGAPGPKLLAAAHRPLPEEVLEVAPPGT